MIRRWYEVSCDECNSAEHFGGSFDSAKKQAIENGWLIVGRFMFCTVDCKKRHREKVKVLKPT